MVNKRKQKTVLSNILFAFLLLSGCNTTRTTILNLKQDLYPIKQKNLWGYIDGKGCIVLQPQYDSSLYCSQGNYLVLYQKNWYAVQPDFSLSNNSLQAPVDTIYDSFDWWERGYQPFNLEPICLHCESVSPITKYINNSNKERFRVEGKGSIFCENGYAIVINRTPLEHGFLSHFENYVIDTSGHKMFEIPKRGFIKPFKNQKAVWLTNDGYQHGILNNQGEIILEDNYQSIYLVDSVFAVVLNYGNSQIFNHPNDKFAIFNMKSKQFITKFEFDELDRNGFKPNLIQGKINGKMVYLNKQGIIVWKEQ